MSALCLICLCAAITLCATALSDDGLSADRDPALVYDGPDELRFMVTSDGLSSIRQAGVEIASGGWHTANGDWIFRAGSNKVHAGKVLRKQINILESNHARVRHEQKDVVTTFDYVFEGEDVTITARVENNHPSFPLNVVRFMGLAFTFTTEPRGVYPGTGAWRDYGALQNYGIDCMHPGFYTRVGGTYLFGMDYGVGTTPVETGLGDRTMFFWTPKQADTKVDLVWSLDHFRYDPIPAGGAKTFAMQMRVSTNTRWKHLLEPYKDYFVKTCGPVRYESDYRMMGVAHVNNTGKLTPDNPYGYQRFRFLHTTAGTNAFCDTVVNGLRGANGQGLLIWGHGGFEPRGAMYRTDFDVLPPEVEDNWPILRDRFAAAGLRFGVCARPSQFQVRTSWEQDGTFDLNADDPQHLKMTWDRFKKMIDLGCTMFMLDSFGNKPSDITIMRYLRTRMGAGIQTFSEHQFDALLPYTGAYSITDHWTQSDERARPGQWHPRPMLELWNIYEWLCPGVNMLARRYETLGKPEQLQDELNFCYSNQMTPMVEDYMINAVAKTVCTVQDLYLDDMGQWRP